MTKAGWKLLIVGAAKVVHRRHQTTGYTSPFITYYSVRNRLIFLTRYGRPLAVLKNAPFILRPLYWKVRRCGLTNMPRHRAFIRAIFDFLMGVRGKGGAPSSRTDKNTGAKRL